MFNNFFPRNSFRLWAHVQNYATAGQATDDSVIRHMRIECLIIKATVPHSEYVILIACLVKYCLKSGMALIEKWLYLIWTSCLWRSPHPHAVITSRQAYKFSRREWHSRHSVTVLKCWKTSCVQLSLGLRQIFLGWEREKLWLHVVCCSPSVWNKWWISRRIWPGGCSTCHAWGNEKAQKVLVLKTEGRDHLEGLAIDSGNNKMDLEDVGWEGMECIDLA